MKKNSLIPALGGLPIKPTEDINTALIPAIPHPITPIPEAHETRPFFRGVMPLPPSINDAYKVARLSVSDGHGGSRAVHRLASTPELEQFKRDAFLMLAHASQNYIDFQVLEAIRNARIKTPLAVSIDGYFLSEWRRDLDGILKHAIDATFDYLRLNDNQVLEIHARKLVDSVDPRAEIEIRCLTR